MEAVVIADGIVSGLKKVCNIKIRRILKMDNSAMVTAGLTEINTILNEIKEWSGLKVAHNLFFRGQADSSWKLFPKVRRKDYKSHPEYDYIQAFVAENDILELNRDPLRLLETAQHYGVATRLLDWSKNLLVALYFACQSSWDSQVHEEVEKSAKKNEVDKAKERCKDGKVFILDYAAYQEHLKTKSPSLSLPSMFSREIHMEVNKRANGIMQQSGEGSVLCYPIIYKPWYHDERIKAQNSYFMIWCHRIEPLENIICDNEKNILIEIEISKNKKSAILCALDKMLGINERVLFPTSDNVGKRANILVENS
jgi:hypothetical protein